MKRQVMLLVDADNVSADVIRQAFDRVMAQHGAVHVRRAYCTAESAAKHLPLFKALSMRPIVNISTGKNSTDIALAVDAISLVDAQRPDVVVIVSSDSDFAPLVIRLREKGCRVEGIGQKGKTGEDSVGVYDDFIDIEHRKPSARATASPAPKVPKATKTAGGASTRRGKAAANGVASEPARAAEPVAPPMADEPPVLRVAAKRTRGRGASRAAEPSPAPRPPLPDDVRQILEAVPELNAGDQVELRIAAERLRAAQLLTKNATSTKLFKKHPEHFVLTPERQPHKVQYRGSVSS